MATINLPNEGDFPWDLNPAITAINSEVEATTNLLTSGRLSEDNITATISFRAPGSFKAYPTLAAAEAAYGAGTFNLGDIVLIDANL